MFKLTNVSKSYKNKSGQLIVLKDVNLFFPEKGLVSILGKSGSGKSTLLNLLVGVLTPTKGTVYYLNKNINKLNSTKKEKFLNNEIGILFQHFNLFDELTALENAIIPCLLNGVNKKDAIKKANDLFNTYKLNYLINQKFTSLSGGEKQRVALIRAIINNPKVILADEPTGALDSKNSSFVMEELKKLSKDKLVIVVTHNEELISKYEDYRISIKDGQASYLREKIDESNIFKTQSRKRQNIFKSFVKLHLKKHKVRNIISGASIAFSSLCLLLSFGYISGSNESTNLYKQKSMLYTSATISKKELIEVKDSPIKISKLTRPNENEIYFLKENIPSIHIENNYQSFFPSYPHITFDNKNYDDIEFSPIYSFETFNSLLSIGRFPAVNEFSEVVVNEEFINHFGYKKESIINHVFKLDVNETVVNINDKGSLIKDEIVIETNLKIVGVVSEFSYLNSPRVYYPYVGLKDIAANYDLKNYSAELGFNISLDEAISFASGSNPVSGYSYNLFIDDLKDVDVLFAFKKQYDVSGQFDISSISYTIGDSYSSLTNVISTSLLAFVAIVLLGTICIVIITSFSNFTENKKESAILHVLGANKKTILLIFNIENILISLSGIIVAFILSIPFKNLLNSILFNTFHLENLITLNLFSFISILFVLLMLVLSFVSTLIPFIYYQKGYISEELKDE